MSTPEIIIILVIAIAMIAILAMRGRGPRVTQITRRRETEDKEGGDDA